jgi:GxxExxY protein
VADFEPIPFETERVAKAVLDAAFRVHSALGSGLLESAYEACLSHDLTLRGASHQTQVTVPVVYEGLRVDSGFRADLIAGGAVIVELKAAEELHPIHEVQLMTYLKLTNLRLGLLINFNVKLLKQGIKRIVR